MNVLLIFFLKYLLAPLLTMLLIVALYIIAKQKAVTLDLKKLLIFMPVLTILLALPSLLGFLRYEFIWGGLLIAICSYLLIGMAFNQFATSKLFKSIGFKEDHLWLIFLVLLPCVILASWISYFVFVWVNRLGYEVWVMLTPMWFLVPPLYLFSINLYLKIPTPFYKPWTVNSALSEKEEEYWNNIDTFRLMQVVVKIKRSPKDQNDTSFSVKLPEDITLGKWFDRFIADQNIRFPNNTIVLSEGKTSYGWIIYTHRWFSIPIFTRVLNFNRNVIDNRIKSNAILYVRRVAENNDNAGEKEKQTSVKQDEAPVKHDKALAEKEQTPTKTD